jgi:hypothetical protein
MMTKFKTEDIGFFDMEDANKVLTLNAELAQLYALDKIDAFVKAHPQTQQKNIDKATKMVRKARNAVELSFSISNFVLAHTSENLAVI